MKLDRPLLVIDCETTGLHPARNQVLSLGMVVVNRHLMKTMRSEWKINLEHPLEILRKEYRSAQKVHKISTWDALFGGEPLEDVIQDLTHRYGKRRAFPESTFVDTLVAMTYPEVRDFFDRYVWQAQRLPVKEYYAKLGITLVEVQEGNPVRFEIDPKPTDEQRLLREAWLGRKPRGAT